MRILITRDGQEVVEDLENTLDTNQFSTRRTHTKNFSQTHYSQRVTLTQSPFSYRNKMNTRNKINKTNNPYQTFTSFNDLSPMSIRKRMITYDPDLQIPTSSDIKNAKFHKISAHNKVTVSKVMTEKYDDTTEPSSNIISVNNKIPSFLLKVNEESMTSDSLGNNVRLYTFNDIIPNKTITDMKIKIIRDQKMKDKLSKINESNFRSSYQDKTDIEKLDELLSCPKINSTKLGLIKYLNNDKQLTPFYISKVINSDAVQINRMNKLAQILVDKEEKMKLQNNLIENKIENAKNEEKILINKQMDTMKRQMEGFKNRLDKYNKKIDRRERYRDLFNDVVIHYWNKYDYDKLNKKNSPKNKYTSSYLFSSNSKLPDLNK